MTYRRILIILITIWGTAGIFGLITPAEADKADDGWVSKVISIQGSVAVKRNGESAWKPIQLGHPLFAGDQVRIGANSRAGIVLRNDSVLRLDQNSTLVFTEIEKETTFIFRLLKGAANFFSRRPRSLKILTPFVNGVVEGTEFYVQVDDDQTRIDLFEGRLLAVNAYGEVQLSRGQGATTMEGSAPQRRLLVRPRDSVQWALYYPPVLTVAPDKVPTAYKDAMAAYSQGRSLEALNNLNQIAENKRDSKFYTLRAALVLHSGNISQSQEDIAQSLILSPENSEAFAIRAIIAVVQNRRQEATEIAQNAVRLNPNSAAAHMALSYAYQASFDLPGALEAAQTAVSNSPGSDTAQARLSELQLSTGKIDAGVQSAEKAVALNPNASHAHTMLGFAYMTQIKIGKAREAFEKAIEFDSAAPLPRLGIGLAKIRQGELAPGRSEIEIATGLDPLNSLMRSYLGKAYFDEKRGPLDKTQFEIAKALDPKDPTPWYYDAIRKQTLNRPGEALQDLQESIKRNDNRAVYRSRLLLDEDLAARSAALGRIYTDLSFQEKALREGAKSLRADPTNYSAHRLLADIYASRPRNEISQVSELLQSQLFQPLNLTPVPPQSTESTLTVSEGTGPLSTAFNEFNPLFTRDRLGLQLSGSVGNQGTWSDEVAVTGLYKRFSFSAGQFHYETEGFRPNNDLEKDIYSAFVQTAFSPYSNIQFEYRKKEIEYGDLELNFDTTVFSADERTKIDQEIPRFGFHYAVNPQHHFIGSLIINRENFDLFERQSSGSLVGTQERKEQFDAYNAESQYLFRSNKVSLIIGAGYYETEDTELLSVIISSSGTVVFSNIDQRSESETWHSNAYAYAYLKPLAELDVTLGFSGDAFSNSRIDPRQFNPKLGFNWYLLPNLTVRGSALRSFRRSLVTNQTIEPTQVAGFAQFFDDYLATDAKRYGLGLDWQITEKIQSGVEATYHDMTHPVFSINAPTRDEEHDEFHHRAYLYWLVLPQVSVSAEYLFDDYERDPLPADGTRPYKLRTHSLPLTIAYFHGFGIFLKARGTYYNQRLEKLTSTTSPPETLRDSFALVDTTIGYRLPKRYGILSFTVSNVFDTDFNYQDMNFLSSSEQDPLIKPERHYYLKATFRF